MAKFDGGEEVVLVASDQFGEDGPKPGTRGIVIGGYIDEGDAWYHLAFLGHKGFFIVKEDMIDG